MSYMKNKLFIFLFLFPVVSFSQTFGIMTTDTNSRRTCGGEQLRVITKGQIVEILDTKGSCSFVRDVTANKSGWVKKRLISGVAITITDSNSRSSCGGEQLRVIPKGQIVEILDKKRSCSFVRDIKANKRGWVQSTLLSKNIFSRSPNVNTQTNNNNISQNNAITKDVVPNCDYTITSPINGGKDVSTNLAIKWKHATGSPKGYYFTIASNTNGKLEYLKTEDGKLIRQLNIGYVNSYSTPKLKPYTTYNIGILPYNSIGLAFGCNQLFSFTTGSGKTISSPNEIIEKRLTDRGILWKWRNFNKVNSKKISMTNNQRKLFIDEVKTWGGVPYRMGGTNRNGVDCSGLIWRGLRQAIDYNGEKLNAQGWAESGKLIAEKSSLIPGDLVCFSNIPGGSNRLVQHIAIYLGNNKFWHAPSSGKVVSEASLDNIYWKPKFIFGVRF